MKSEPTGPFDPPKCRHGKFLYPCLECLKEDKTIRDIVYPLIDDYWNSKGKEDLYHIVYRAYRMGMRQEHINIKGK